MADPSSAMAGAGRIWQRNTHQARRASDPIHSDMKLGYYIVSLLSIALLTVDGWTEPAVSKLGADAPIQLRGWPLLWADDSGIASQAGLVRTVHVARTDLSPVLAADRPWEAERVYVYGSAYQDE